MIKSKKTHWIISALSESTVNIIIIMIPFVIGFIKFKYYEGGDKITNATAIAETFSVMAVAIFSATILAPIFYSVVKDPPIKYKVMFLLGSIIIYSLGIVIYVFEINSASQADALQGATWIVLTGALILYISNIFINNMSHYSESAPSLIAKGTSEDLKDYKNHRRQ